MYINSGKDKKKTGEVLMIDPRRNMLKVKGMNRRKARTETASFSHNCDF